MSERFELPPGVAVSRLTDKLADRRERIATALLAASIVRFGLTTDQMIEDAVENADTLIRRLDWEATP